MKTIGQLFYRSAALFVSILLALVVAMPISSSVSARPTAQASAPVSDDFNRCSPAAVWDFENPADASGADPVIAGPFSGESILRMSVPGGNEQFTFSSTNLNAPRLMQPIADTNFSVEAKFLAPLNSATADYKIQGILVRDASNASQPKWFRFDFNSHQDNLDSYLGYVNAAGTLVHIQNVTDLPGGSPTSGPLFLRVTRSGDTWTIVHQVGESGTFVKTFTFQESTYDTDFTVTDIGIFVAHSSSSSTYPAHTMQIDYFRNMADSAFLASEDVEVLTVQTAGDGLGIVDWPMTDSDQCSGNTVTLTASPVGGSTFIGWSGAVSGANPTVNVVMDAPKTVIATFSSSGEPIDLPFDMYLPQAFN